MSLSLFWRDPFFNDPFQELRRMQREMDTLFGLVESTNQTKDNNKSIDKTVTTSSFIWNPVCDIKETDKDYIVHAELPGVPKENINIELENGILTISGEKKEEKKEENEKYHRIERSYGKFSRSMTVPEGVTHDQIKAKFENGVLEITFPKPPEPKKRCAFHTRSKNESPSRVFMNWYRWCFCRLC
jgi:HSP20 family protein